MTSMPVPTPPREPAAELGMTLRKLSIALTNTSLLRQLIETRDRREAQGQKRSRLNAPIPRKGRSLTKAVGKFEVARAAAAESAVRDEQPLIANIRKHLIEPSGPAIEQARAAVDAGGASAVDRALHPGSLLSQVELGEHLDQLAFVLLRIDTSFALHRGVLANEASEIEAHAKWLRAFEVRLSEAVRALGGASSTGTAGVVNRAVAGTEAPKDFQPGRWFIAALKKYRKKRSKAKITLHQLRRARVKELGAGGSHRTSPGAPWRYSVSRVCNAPSFSMYKEAFRAAEQDGLDIPSRRPKHR